MGYSIGDVAVKTPFFNKKTLQSTNADVQAAMAQIRALRTPEQIQQASDAYKNAISGIGSLTNYQPQSVAAGQMANVPDAVAGQMAPVQQVAAQRARIAQMQGPASWTQPGTAEAYMNPYIQTSLQAQQELANRQYAQQLNQILGEATGKGAYGGSRTQLAYKQQQLNQNLENQARNAAGLSQAYQQGMGQFTTEQQMGQAANQANMAARNQAYQNYVAQQLAAQQANQQAGLTSGQANLSAYQQAMLANQQAGLTAGQANLNAYQQAALANQQAGLTANQQNLGAYSTMGQLGSGLGAMGQLQNQIQQGNISALAQSGAAQTNLAQNYYNRQAQNAANVLNMPLTFTTAGIASMPQTLGSTGFGSQFSTPAYAWG